mgnify:CR=1 FL=1
MELFSEKWMKKFMSELNKEHALSGDLEKIGFKSAISYCIDGENEPRGIITIDQGKAVSAGAYNGEKLNWDLRAREDSSKTWIQKEMGIMGLVAAYSTLRLKFALGDYKSMIKAPRMAAPFIKSFTVMGRV